MLMHSELSLLEQLKAVNRLIWLTQEPANFEAIYDLDELLQKTNLSQISLDYLKSQPEVAAVIQERYLAPVPDLNKLMAYPQESLGYAFASHLIANQFDPTFYRQRNVIDDVSYIAVRRSQTHDIHHVITGFGTDLGGELGLQAFQFAQFRSPIAITLLVTGIIHNFANPHTLEEQMKQIFCGWEMGLKAKPLMAQKWEEQWAKPLLQWRAELGIEPVNPYVGLSIAA
jgi:ubiquinone biosynthesis protein Coq4